MSHFGNDGWWNGSFDPETFIEAGHRLPGYMYGINSEAPYFKSLLHERDFIDAYRFCPPLKAIIGKKARCHNNGILEFVHPITNRPARGSEAHMLEKLLHQPNVLQAGDQYFSQLNHYVDLMGYCPILIMRVPGFVDEIKAIWNVPPWLFDIDYTRKWLWEYKLTGIWKKFYIFWEGKQVEIDPRDLRFVFDDGIGSECDTNLMIPDSKLVGMDYVVSNIVAAYKARNTLITKRGAIGILSNEGTDAKGTPLTIDTDIRKDLQKDFKSYGIVGQPFQIILTDAKVKWQQMGFPTKDLLLFEEITDDIDRLCDAYGYPPELLSRPKGATYENKNQARIDLYQDTIIPESVSRMSQLTSALVSKDTPIKIKKNFDKVPALQLEAKAKAEAREKLDHACLIEYKNGLITKNVWLEKLGEEKRTDPEFDKYYIDTKEYADSIASQNNRAPEEK